MNVHEEYKINKFSKIYNFFTD